MGMHINSAGFALSLWPVQSNVMSVYLFLVKAIQLLGGCQSSWEHPHLQLFQTTTQRFPSKPLNVPASAGPHGHISRRQRAHPLQGSFTGVWISWAKTCYKCSSVLCFFFFSFFGNPLLACFCGTKLRMAESSSGALLMQSLRCQRQGVLFQPALSLL